MVGVEPRQWFETIPTIRGGVPFLPVSPTQRSVANGDGLFMQQLAERVWLPFSDTLKRTRSFNAVVTSSVTPSAAAIGRTDLLCYVCETRGQSIIRRNDGARFQNFITQNPNAAGFTGNINMPTGQAIVSEIWLDRMNTDIGVAWRAVYHEFMHNKTRWAQNEDPDWVHTMGGGDIATVDGPAKFLNVNANNATIMAGRLAIANTQFWQVLP
jgi:hypothetical protein